MTLPNILTGRAGLVKKDGSAIANIHVTFWQFSPTVNTMRFASDKTSGHKVGFATVYDFEAMMRIKIPASGIQVPLGPGSTFTAQFHGDGTGNNYISAPVMVDGPPIPCDIQDGQNAELEYTLVPRGPATFYGLYWWGSGSSGRMSG